MKPFFDVGRYSGRWPKTIPVLLAFVIAATGCSKSSKQPAATPQVAPPSADAAPAMSTPAPAPVTTAPAPTGNPQPLPKEGSLTQLQLLNRAMVGWMRDNHRRPQNF